MTPSDLLTLRQELDQLDQEIDRLFRRRQELSEAVYEAKAKTAWNLRDPEREAQKKAQHPGAERLWDCLMRLSRRRQHELALAAKLQDSSSSQSVGTIRLKLSDTTEALAECLDQAVDAGVKIESLQQEADKPCFLLRLAQDNPAERVHFLLTLWQAEGLEFDCLA